MAVRRVEGVLDGLDGGDDVADRPRVPGLGWMRCERRAPAPRFPWHARRDPSIVGWPRRVADGDLDVDQQREQFRAAETIVADGTQAPLGGGTRQVVVAAREVQARRREQRLEMALLAEEELLGVGETSLADPQLGERDRADASSGIDIARSNSSMARTSTRSASLHCPSSHSSVACTASQ